MASIVVLIHGLGRTQRSMQPLARYLERSGLKTHLFGYDSRRLTIEQITEQLTRNIEQLHQSYSKIHFVTHSLGGIVVRNYLTQFNTPPDFIGRTVMLAPPNQGSEVIDFWRKNSIRHSVFKKFMGPTAIRLHTQADSLPNTLPTLEQYTIGVIAGTRSIEYWFNPLFKSTHDGKVSVTSSQLHPKHLHLSVHTTHTFIMNHPEVRRKILSFLQQGAF